MINEKDLPTSLQYSSKWSEWSETDRLLLFHSKIYVSNILDFYYHIVFLHYDF